MAASGWMIRILAFTWPELADADLVDGGIAYFPFADPSGPATEGSFSLDGKHPLDERINLARQLFDIWLRSAARSIRSAVLTLTILLVLNLIIMRVR